MHSSSKEKKITVKFFLNQALEPITGEKGQKHYPLYVQVTYNRKNMQFRSKYGLAYKNLKEVPSGLMSFEEKLLAKIIRHEAKQRSNEYELKGLKRKYEVYSTSLYQMMEEHFKPRLRLAILKIGSELVQVLNFDQSQATVALLYEAATRLFPNFERNLPQKLRDDLEAYSLYRTLSPEPALAFNFPTIIDWVDGSYRTELTELTGHGMTRSRVTVKNVTSLLNQAAENRIKALENEK